jgi:3'-5' exoribonuclease
VKLAKEELNLDAVNRLLNALEVSGISEPLYRVCRGVLADARFADTPASAGHHPIPHQERGGLALHTLEVLTAAVSMCGEDRDMANLAIVAAICHDYGKIHEYAFLDGKATKLPFAKRIGHVAYSWTYFLESAQKFGVARDEMEEIAHAILAHHGRREWGSPVEPQTKLAYIIHAADMMSTNGLVSCQ